MLRSYLYGRCMVISSVIEEQDQLSLIQTQTLSSRPSFFAIGCLTGIIAIFCKYSFSSSFSASAVLFLIITGDVILILDITAMKKPRSFPPFDVPSILSIAPFIILLKTVSNSIGTNSDGKMSESESASQVGFRFFSFSKVKTWNKIHPMTKYLADFEFWGLKQWTTTKHIRERIVSLQ